MLDGYAAGTNFGRRPIIKHNSAKATFEDDLSQRFAG
jgi:hypothetical protein